MYMPHLTHLVDQWGEFAWVSEAKRDTKGRDDPLGGSCPELAKV